MYIDHTQVISFPTCLVINNVLFYEVRKYLLTLKIPPRSLYYHSSRFWSEGTLLPLYSAYNYNATRVSHLYSCNESCSLIFSLSR